ncbi:T-cell surface protein tactile [Rhynchocyon petersi]
METKWTYCAICSIIQIHFVRGVWGESANTEDIYALPGSDVNLTCQTQAKSFVVQTQWSKVTSEVELIALYHPQHGFFCTFKNTPCNSLVSFTETPGNVLKTLKWTLHLKDVSSSLSGNYECSYTLYPEGTWTKSYNLLIQTNVAYEEWRSSHVVETEMNQTLEIPCFQNVSLETSSVFTFAWLVEDNGTQETLITQDNSISNSTYFKGRIKLGANYGLFLSPVQIHDNDLNFSCHAKARPGKILKSTTTVKVFAKPEIPTIVENNSTDGLKKRNFTCFLRNVFPTANLTWFLDGEFLQGEKEGIHITSQEGKGKDGYLKLESVLTMIHIKEPSQSNNLTIWCMALFPVPGNKMLNLSSGKISFSLDSWMPRETDRVTPSVSWMPSKTDRISPSVSWMPSETDRTPTSVSWMPSETDRIPPSVSWMPSKTDRMSPSTAHLTLHSEYLKS